MATDDFLSRDELNGLGLFAVGRNVRISRHAAIFSPERISVGDDSRIDAFAVLSAGQPHLRIGRHVHISSSVVIVGRAAVEIGDFTSLSPRVTILSSSDDFSGAYMTGPTVPAEFRSTVDAPVVIAEHVVVGSGTIVLPGITIGESSAVGAASLITDDVAPFTLVAGVPAKLLRERSREHRELAQRMQAQETAERGGSVRDPGSE